MAESSGSKTDTLIKLVLVFFISLLSFTVGTFVGKQFSDSQHKFAMLESGYDSGETAERSTASIPPDVNHMKPTSALSDDDIARLADELEIEENGERTPAKENMAKKEMIVNKVTDKVIKGESIVLKPKKMHDSLMIKKTLPKAVSNTTIGKYTVQVGSFGTEGEAQKRASELKSKGYGAFYVPAAISGKTWYRVSVGVFTNKSEAATYRKKFLAESNVNSAYVQMIRR